MMIKRMTMFLAISMLTCSTAYTGSAFERMTQDNAGYIFDASYTDSMIRETGIDNQELMVAKLFSDGAAKKWKSLTEQNFSKEQIRDFFLGAVLFRGTVSERGGVAAFYNPFWDTILITESFDVNVNIKGKTESIRKINDFRFLSGAVFRGDSEDTARKVVADIAKPPLNVAYTICGLFSRTQKHFNSLYANLKYPLLMNDENDRSENNLRQIQACSALRLKMATTFADTKENYKEAWQLVSTLMKGKLPMFHLLFSSEYAKLMAEYFVKMPMEIRQDFEPYAYYPDKMNPKVRCYVYVNTKFPRLFAVMVLGTGYGNTSFEWFDFAYSDEIEAAFGEVEKEARK